MTEFLIKQGRIGCVPGVDFGPLGEGYVRFCFARERAELLARSTRCNRYSGNRQSAMAET